MKYLKHIILIGIIVSLSTSCVENSSKYKALLAQLDSLQGNYGNKTDQLDEAFATINEVEEGLKSIRESENILAVQYKDGLVISEESREQIKADMQTIHDAISQYKKEIAQLKKSSTFKSKQFEKRLKAITAELEEKSKLIESYQQQLAEKDAQLQIKTKEIYSLGEVVATLKKDVQNLNEESLQLKQKIASQDEEIYSAYYIVGTKGQLIDAGVMTRGGLFKSSKISYQAEKSVFVKIDLREITTINTNADKAKVLSIHPKGTYAIEQSDDGEMILTISDPEAFWEHTKYLVIQVQ